MWPHEALKLPNIFINLLWEEIYWSGLKYTSFLYHLEKQKFHSFAHLLFLPTV